MSLPLLFGHTNEKQCHIKQQCLQQFKQSAKIVNVAFALVLSFQIHTNPYYIYDGNVINFQFTPELQMRKSRCNLKSVENAISCGDVNTCASFISHQG